MKHSTDEAANSQESERIRRIHERVCKVRSSEEIGVKYMQAWEERYYDKQEAREEGLEEGREEGRKEGRKEGQEEERTRINALNQRLLDEQRIDDLRRTVLDVEYQKQLLEEYGL